MNKKYTLKYRQPGQLFWRRLKNVVGDGIEGGFRFFLLDDDTLVAVSINAEVVFSPKRAESILHKMSAEAGQPIQRK